MEISLDLTAVANDPKATLFYPFTTTVIEILLDREPMPIGEESPICRILPPPV